MVEIGGSRRFQRSGRRSWTNAPCSLREQIMPEGLFNRMTMPGIGSSGAPSITMRLDRSGVTGMRLVASSMAAPSRLIRCARAKRAISLRVPYPIEDSSLSMREVGVLAIAFGSTNHAKSPQGSPPTARIASAGRAQNMLNELGRTVIDFKGLHQPILLSP